MTVFCIVNYLQRHINYKKLSPGALIVHLFELFVALDVIDMNTKMVEASRLFKGCIRSKTVILEILGV